MPCHIKTVLHHRGQACKGAAGRPHHMHLPDVAPLAVQLRVGGHASDAASAAGVAAAAADCDRRQAARSRRVAQTQAEAGAGGGDGGDGSPRV